MGFDLYIHLKLMMCPIKGKPFYYGKNLEKIYEILDFSVPEDIRSYLVGRGHHFFAYLRFLDYSEQTEVDLEPFLENYPEWREILEDEAYESYWTQEDHNKFAELLEYLHELPYPFSISWSY